MVTKVLPERERGQRRGLTTNGRGRFFRAYLHERRKKLRRGNRAVVHRKTVVGCFRTVLTATVCRTVVAKCHDLTSLDFTPNAANSLQSVASFVWHNDCPRQQRTACFSTRFVGS
jgi:hypothetical protein